MVWKKEIIEQVSDEVKDKVLPEFVGAVKFSSDTKTFIFKKDGLVNFYECPDILGKEPQRYVTTFKIDELREMLKDRD